MLTLYRTLCSTDHKHRPFHELIKLGSGTREDLLRLQDEDVQKWQAQDLQIERENASDDEEIPSTWERMGGYFESQRWEIERKDPQECRKFTGYREGDSWSIVYHIQPPPLHSTI